MPRRYPLQLIAAAAASLAVAGCSAVPLDLGGDSAGAQLLKNLDKCKRVYRGAIGAGVTGSLYIYCPGSTPAAVPPEYADEEPDPVANPTMSQNPDTEDF